VALVGNGFRDFGSGRVGGKAQRKAGMKKRHEEAKYGGARQIAQR
jgi:hypothetical protein